MKKLTFKDITKDELIEYFFNPITGGFQIPANKDALFIWVNQKRGNAMLDTQEACAEEMQKAFDEYMKYLREGNSKEDIDEKLSLFQKGNKAWERYEKARKEYDRLTDKIDQHLEVGKYYKKG